MEPVAVPLGNLLSVAHCLPEVCPSGPSGTYKTLCYLSQLPLQSIKHMMMVWPVCRAVVLAQHPRLNDLTLPMEFIDGDRWPHIWAWLDIQEQRLGATLPLLPAVDSDWLRHGWIDIPRAVTPEGLPVHIEFEDAKILFT